MTSITVLTSLRLLMAGTAKTERKKMFSDREKKILQTWLEYWQDADSPLAGNLTYQEVFDLCTKLGIGQPTKLAQFIEQHSGEKYVPQQPQS